MAVMLGSVSTKVVKVQTVVRMEDVPTIAHEGLQPQRFVRSAAVWPLVEAVGDDLAGMANLVRRRHELPAVPSLEKLWTEAVYERVRMCLQPFAPSRLDCLYAVEMGYDAFAILLELGLDTVAFNCAGFPVEGPAILATHTRGSWFAADMRLFRPPHTLTPSSTQITQGLADIKLRAERYWTGEASGAPLTELLCEALERP